MYYVIYIVKLVNSPLALMENGGDQENILNVLQDIYKEFLKNTADFK